MSGPAGKRHEVVLALRRLENTENDAERVTTCLSTLRRSRIRMIDSVRSLSCSESKRPGVTTVGAALAIEKVQRVS
jgi:hypothetical protein